ncbi:peptidylprolyl isomerase [Pontibaca salina]|uniref:Parvulin-like PPIase n=1 Tax=Pontibaca salina TaxID=2795731 RepID=A0A934HT80_9RHOB|nr:peptidylprolyl isomerase [Pontibaca salina]MBI6629783.1 peptidylprolyl isomerase [Pontibaca salina]
MQLKTSTLTSFLPRLARCAAPLVFSITLTVGAGLVPLAASAQSLFAPAITVNDDVITRYELEQRAQFLRLLRAPGNPVDLAREALIEDRLKQQAISQTEITLTPENIKAGIAEFASRTDLEPDDFVKALEQGGVSYESFRDFVTVSLAWREYVRQRFLSRANPTKDEVARAMATDDGGSTVSVLLNEIIVPITPQTLDQVEQLTEELSNIRGFDAFAEAARQYSASESRQSGGRIPWMALSDLPVALRPVIMGLRPGEVTAPIPLSNAVALFQMREVRETGRVKPGYSKISYAKYHIPGGRSAEGLTQAAQIAARVDTCDDLYGIAKDQPAEVLERLDQSPGEIPSDIALELAKLDEGEISTTLTRSDGQTLLFLMLCGRTAESKAGATAEDIANMLVQERLEAFATNYLDQLRGNAVIVSR